MPAYSSRVSAADVTHGGRKALHNLAAGDTFYLPKVLGGASACDVAFAELLHGADYVQMYHFPAAGSGKAPEPIPRLVTAQTGSRALYRMPGCNQRNIATTEPLPAVRRLLQQADAHLGAAQPPLNHVVLTLYRNQEDSLAPHQDKTLDLAADTHVVSLSLGAARPIVFTPLDPRRAREAFAVLLQPGSLLAIGPKTNAAWRHGVPKLREACGPRISLSARTIATFLGADGASVEGQGAAHQTPHYPFVEQHADAAAYDEAAQEAIAAGNAVAQLQLTRLRQQHPHPDRRPCASMDDVEALVQRRGYPHTAREMLDDLLRAAQYVVETPPTLHATVGDACDNCAPVQPLTFDAERLEVCVAARAKFGRPLQSFFGCQPLHSNLLSMLHSHAHDAHANPKPIPRWFWDKYHDADGDHGETHAHWLPFVNDA